MKKFFISLCVCFLFLGNVIANSIPDGKELFVLACEFSKNADMWKEAKISGFDIAENKYAVTGYTVNKFMLGFQRQDYTVILEGKENTYTVSVVNMKTVNCDKNGNPIKGNSPLDNPKSTMDKIADLISVDLDKIFTGWTSAEYEEKLNNVLTNPAFIKEVCDGTTELYAKKFIEKFAIEGRAITINGKVSSVKENKPEDHYVKTLEKLGGTLPEFYNYAYRMNISCPYSSLFMEGGDLFHPVITPKTVLVTYYSNNDDLIFVKEGSEKQYSGKIKSVDFNKSTGKFLGLTVYDN